MYIWVDDAKNFTVQNYTWTIKVTANGGRVFYTDFIGKVIYQCKYDNITYVRNIPSTNARSSDM